MEISELTEKVSAAENAQIFASPSFAPDWIVALYPYAPYFMSATLFAGVFGIFLVRGARSLRTIILAFALALFAAGTPAILTYVRTGGGQVAHAGPRMQPTTVRIEKVSETEADVSWQTQEQTLGLVRYSERNVVRPGDSLRRYVVRRRGKADPVCV